MDNIKDNCVSCGSEINRGKISRETYYLNFGNYCRFCTARAEAIVSAQKAIKNFALLKTEKRKAILEKRIKRLGIYRIKIDDFIKNNKQMQLFLKSLKEKDIEI